MLEVNGQLINAEVEEILNVLRQALHAKGIDRFAKIFPSGNNVMTCCPFHKEGQERKPSFGINAKDGICHCFGCGWVGSIQEMISNCFGYDDMGLYGSRWLIRNFLTISVEERPDIELDMSRGRKEIKREYVSEEELDEYRYYHPYWTKRGIVSDWILNLFDLGYDRKTQCITFPIRDIKGRCLFVARRSVNSKFFNYPEGAEKPLYGLYELYQHSQDRYENIIVCESMLDALTCWEFGRYAVALNGLGNDIQYKQLSELPTRELILATDMDEAGLRARDRLKNRVKGKIIREYFWDVKEAKDINDMDKKMFEKLKEVF